MKKITIKTKGMHCVSCERIIKDAILNLDGIKSADVNWTTEKATITFNPEKVQIKDIMKTVEKAGYEAEETSQKEKSGSFMKRLFGGSK